MKVDKSVTQYVDRVKKLENRLDTSEKNDAKKGRIHSKLRGISKIYVITRNPIGKLGKKHHQEIEVLMKKEMEVRVSGPKNLETKPKMDKAFVSGLSIPLKGPATTVESHGI